jgi:hypothetical protein
MFNALQAGVVDVRGTFQQWTSAAMSVTVMSPSSDSCVGCWDY